MVSCESNDHLGKNGKGVPGRHGSQNHDSRSRQDFQASAMALAPVPWQVEHLAATRVATRVPCFLPLQRNF